MTARLRQAEDRLGLGCGCHGSDQSLGAPTGGRPVRGQLPGRHIRVAGEPLSEAGVDLLALAGKDRRVDCLGQQGMAEAKPARFLIGNEQTMLDRLSERHTKLGVSQPGRVVQQRERNFSTSRRSEPQHALGLQAEPVDPEHQQVAQAVGQPPSRGFRGGEELSAKKGFPSAR